MRKEQKVANRYLRARVPRSATLRVANRRTEMARTVAPPIGRQVRYRSSVRSSDKRFLPNEKPLFDYQIEAYQVGAAGFA